MVIEQIIGSYNVPIDGINTIALTKAAYDIENPAKRYGDFSKSIRIPESDQVNLLFENLFHLNVALQSFNPNVKQTYRLIADGILILNGYCQLRDIVSVDGEIHYVIQATGGVGGLFDSIGESELTDLDFSSLDHTWNETNIAASWSPTLGTGYVYPMIYYGYKNNNIIWYVEDFKPAIFLKEYIDAIFDAAGYTYTSTFFASTRFKSLIIPQASDVVKKSDATILDRQFLVSRETSSQANIEPTPVFNLTSTSPFIFNDDSTSPNYNTGATEYNTSTGIYTAGTGRNINGVAVKAFLKLNFDYTQSSASKTTWINAFLAGLDKAWIEILVVRTRSGTESIVETMEYDITSAMTGQSLTASYTSPNFTGICSSVDFDIEAGDEIELRLGVIWIKAVGAGGQVYLDGSDFDVTLQTDSAYGLVVTNPNINPGETMVMNDTIPQDVTQRELLDAIIKRFNLFMQYDPQNENNIIIEPLIDFMETTQNDISTWIDDSKERIITPLGALQSGEYIFTDQDDSDELNKVYKAQKAESYGTQRVNIDNDFQTKTKKITSAFAPTPLWAAIKENDRVISSIAYERESLGDYAKGTGKIRLLYWGGLLTTNQTWYIQGGSARTTFPYAGHLDNPYDPQFDLSWGVPRLLFYDFSGGGLNDMLYTDKNCYNIYWSKHINEITDKDSKTLTCNVFLDFARYQNLNFQHIYHIDGVNWRLLRVDDFDVVNAKTTKCVFLKLETASSFTGSQENIYRGSGVFAGGSDKPTGGNGERLGQSSGAGRGIFYGENTKAHERNLIFSDSVEVYGSENIVSGSKSSKAFASNQMIINSPGYEARRPFEAAINHVFMEIRQDLSFDSTLFTAFSSSPFQAIPNPASDEYIDIKKIIFKTSTSTAISGGNALILRTNSSNNTLATSSGTFFNTSDNLEEGTISANPLDLGEGAELYQASDMGGGAGTTLFVYIIYQIVRI